jgi:hypothetical protein
MASSLGPVHYGADQVGLVVEVVVELRLAHSGRVDDIVDAGGADPVGADQVGGHGDDPVSRRPALAGLGRCWHARHPSRFLDLTVHFLPGRHLLD